MPDLGGERSQGESQHSEQRPRVRPAPVGFTKQQHAYVTSLFHRYRGVLHRYLGRLMSMDDAAELVQETYFRLLRHGQMMQLDTVARSYLFRTATNLARDQHRRHRVRRTDKHVPLDDASGGEEFDPGEQLSAEQILYALERAVAGLPRETRMVFMLVRFRDMTYPDIAQFMNISTRTVARKMADAMQVLHSVVEASQ